MLEPQQPQKIYQRILNGHDLNLIKTSQAGNEENRDTAESNKERADKSIGLAQEVTIAVVWTDGRS